MNHVEVYRGTARTLNFNLGGGSSNMTPYFFRVGTVRRDHTEGISSIAPVLTIYDRQPPTALYYNWSSTVCERASVLNKQPTSSLEGYV